MLFRSKTSPVVLVNLEQAIHSETADPEKIYSYAELAYIDGHQAIASGNEAKALDLFGAAASHAYLYLFDSNLDHSRNPYDPQFRQACDLYNGALEAGLRILKHRGRLKPGAVQTIKTSQQNFDLSIELHGPWHPEDIGQLEFVSDYDIEGLRNHYQTFGLGVPLIAVRAKHAGKDPAEKYYPAGFTFPLTAFLRDRKSTRLNSSH